MSMLHVCADDAGDRPLGVETMEVINVVSTTSHLYNGSTIRHCVNALEAEAALKALNAIAVSLITPLLSNFIQKLFSFG